MGLNVTQKDIEIERLVMDIVQKEYEPFKHIMFKHNVDEETALYDFHGYYLDLHKISVDIKALYNPPYMFKNNMVSIDKWDEFINNQANVDHYIVYYYPQDFLIRMFDLGKCHDAFVGTARIYHKRTKEHREDKVAFLPISNNLMEIKI